MWRPVGPTGPRFQPAPTGITYGWANGDDPDDRYYWNSASVPTSPSAGGGNDIAYFYRFVSQGRIDALTDAAARGRDPGTRRALYVRNERLLVEQAPVIFLYWPDSLMVVCAASLPARSRCRSGTSRTGVDPRPPAGGRVWLARSCDRGRGNKAIIAWKRTRGARYGMRCAMRKPA